MICHHHQCVFVHIPKTGGQSVEHVFLDLLGLSWETRAPLLLRYNDRPELGPPRLAHLRAEEYVRYKYMTQEMFDDYFKFSFVRNPWSRAVSFYKYMGYETKCGFKKFLMKVLNKKLSSNESWFVRPQSDFLYSSRGDLLVDYVGRFENLQEDFNSVCEGVGIEPTRLAHINASAARGAGKGRNLGKSALLKRLSRAIGGSNDVRKSYHEYYDEESKDFVFRKYRQDVECFGYIFDE